MQKNIPIQKIGVSKKLSSPGSSQRLRCVDIFAGAGGLSLAAENIGFDVKVAVEKDRHACQTYRHNIQKNSLSNIKLYENDILELNPFSIAERHFPEKENCDIVLGGPPCQGFSVHRINDSGVDDPRNELILRYFDFVRALEPKIFLMENVPGILWPRHQEYLNQFRKNSCKAGYSIRPPTVLDARDYGVPQRRRRVFILGIRNDVEFTADWPPIASHGDEKFLKKNASLKQWVAASTVFEKPLSPEDENNHHMNHTPEIIEVFKSTPLNGGSRHQSNRILSCHKKHSGHKDVYGRIDPSRPGPTMTTACINPSKGRFVHPTEHHGITLRHAARFQTFPDGFVFKGGLMGAGKQIGNAVPVKLAEILLDTILRGLCPQPDTTAIQNLKRTVNG